jgi:hypothetical protein
MLAGYDSHVSIAVWRIYSDNSSPQFSESTKFETKATLRRHFKMSGLKKSVIRNMELLIIDEVVCFVQIY